MIIIQLLYMDTTSEKKGLNDIKHMYKNLSYMDQYAGSVLVFVIITFAIIVIYAYCLAKLNIKPIVEDWSNQRCKPYFMPIAGFLNKPSNMTAEDYTLQNFNYCSQNILTSITGYMVEPITFLANSINSIVSSMSQDINSARAMFDKVRTFFQTITEEIMGRIMNIMIPLQEIIIKFRDLVGKIQGAMTAGLYTLLGTYYTLQSLMGAIAESIIIVLIAMAAMIFVFWLIPFTWGAAISATSVFVALSIPLAVMLAFLTDVLHVSPNLSIPTLQMPAMKCFDKNTLFILKDGTTKKIIDIEPGEELLFDGTITAKIKVETNGSIMYNLSNIVVSDTHLVYYNDGWIRVKEHPEAIKLEEYNEPYLYCLNTSTKHISFCNFLFSDWDELVGYDLSYILNQTDNGYPLFTNEIHEILDGGFVGTTQIQLLNHEVKCIKDLQIGDILMNGEKVYGLVEIHGDTVMHQGECDLGKNTKLVCAPNVIYYDGNYITTTLALSEEKCAKLNSNEPKLYHLLTDCKVFKINEVTICDYNASIDLFLEKD